MALCLSGGDGDSDRFSRFLVGLVFVGLVFVGLVFVGLVFVGLVRAA
jgi:hypothetical protein